MSLLSIFPRKWIYIIPSIVAMPVAQSANVIYQHSFSGTSATNLGGTGLDVSTNSLGGTTGAAWLSSTRFKADGSIATTDAAGSAFVAFSPQAGNIYSISVETRATPRASSPGNFLVTAVPEPSSGLLGMIAFASLALKRKRNALKAWPLVACCSLSLMDRSEAADHYETYVRTSEDFRSVKQDKECALKAWPSWTYMPWTYQWHIGYDDASGEWSRAHGYSGTLVDQGHLLSESTKKERLDWISKHDLRFYLDHAAGKGILHLWDGDKVKPHLDQLQGTGTRNVPLNAGAEAELKEIMKRHIGAVKDSPHRAAYALDDEPSWGHFVRPAMWQITDDPAAYPRWLREVYGPDAPKREKWVSYDDIRTQLPNWSIADFDASPLMDQWSFSDTYWANLLGRLVRFSNELDPATPCGFVGGQAPNAFGGYDYAKLMRKIQFIESYNNGSSQAIIRSFNPRNALPTVTTHFHRDTDDTIWQTWYYLAHGNRGHIGWVEKWFDGKTPKSWHAEVAPSYLEADRKIGPLMAGAEWRHDGVAIYYSHASIQLGWILDAEPHGKTWRQRNSDERLSSGAHVRRAWENMLRDTGLQYNFINYVDVIQNGVPAEYKVLILPGVLCLSDSEALAIKAFCERGGTVIADYLPGLWDQHGRGRKDGGALDAMFGVKHPSTLSAKDIFGAKYWVEVDQDANFSWKDYEGFLTNKNDCVKDASGFYKAVRAMEVDHVAPAGRGKAILMNLSPQWYNAHREAGFEMAKKRGVFMKHVTAAGVRPWVRITETEETVHGYEITYWKQPADDGKASRTILYVCSNPEIRGTSLGGGNSAGLKADTLPIKLRFTRSIQKVRDERTGEALGDGAEFGRQWKQNEAIVLSFEG
ncbi:MAG: beta-galactosidase trimerization domain-containing protein [Akkermansiaceae bacterium]|nr:beta-galactosidase trimerization domain-containing protein [Akkermansiaceae bacterium]